MNTRNLVRKLLLVPALLAWFSLSANAFYDASVGRWLNRDPIGEEGGINLYAFVANNPISWFDSDGHASVATPAGASIVAEAEAAAAGYASAAAQAAAQAAASSGVAATGSGRGKKCEPEDPCDRAKRILDALRKNHGTLLRDVSNVIKAQGTQTDLGNVSGLTDELRKMIGDLYQAAADCNRQNRDNSFNDERARFLRGERSTGPGSNSK